MEPLFPHLTSTGPSPSHRLVLSTYRSAFFSCVDTGTLRPLVLPYHFYGCILLLLYLCIPHTKNSMVYAARWPVLAVIIAFQWKTIWETSSPDTAVAFAAGLTAMWGIVWSVTWLVLRKPQWDARRVERRRVKRGREAARAPGVVQNGDHASSKTSAMGSNGLTGLKSRGGHVPVADSFLEHNAEGLGGDEEFEYYWQSYPDNFLDRFLWLSEMLMSFRGPGWNWAIPPLPARPPFVNAQLGEAVDETSKSGVSHTGLRRHDTRAELFRSRIPTFIVGYFILDALKVLMMRDSYFIFGPNTYALPSHLQGFSPLSLHFIRQGICAIAIVTALEMCFRLAPLGFSLIIGPRILGLQAEAWYYPTQWGYVSNIANKGLNGLWGSWWHQTFRFAFSAPSNYLIKEGWVKAKSPAARVLALFFAFGISGCLHFAGSASQFPSTKLSHPPIFFMLQALGIVVQLGLCSLFGPLIKPLPKVARQAGNVLFVVTWLLSTCAWLTDDFARGGIWLFEPIPISLFRGLGFGVDGDGWWCWRDLGVWWYTGDRWWKSGIAI